MLNPGEVLYQDAATNGGLTAPIVAASFLRQYRDMITQRVLLFKHGGVDQKVDVLDLMIKNKQVGVVVVEKEGEEKEHCWEPFPPLIRQRTSFAVAWLKGEIFCIGIGNSSIPNWQYNVSAAATGGWSHVGRFTSTTLVVVEVVPLLRIPRVNRIIGIEFEKEKLPAKLRDVDDVEEDKELVTMLYNIYKSEYGQRK